VNIFYVYEYIRLDTNEPFYIGKGSNERWKQLVKDRNRYFKNIVKNIPIAVCILEENLTEEEALATEAWYIWQLRDVQGYWLVNMTDGGDGIAGHKHSSETKQKISAAISKRGNKARICSYIFTDINTKETLEFNGIKEIRDYFKVTNISYHIKKGYYKNYNISKK
jgi:patatin-like phospholipase/acyl hydrolase